MPGSRVVTGLVALALVAASGTGGVAVGEFVTGSMSGFYGSVAPRLRDAGPRVVTSEPPAPSPAERYAPMPADTWSAAPALTDAPPPVASDSRRWERENEDEARRWQAPNVRDAERTANPAPIGDDAAPDPNAPSGDHGPAAPTLLPDQIPA